MNFIYIASAFYNFNDNSVWQPNDPFITNNTLTWALCRPDLRKIALYFIKNNPNKYFTVLFCHGIRSTKYNIQPFPFLYGKFNTFISHEQYWNQFESSRMSNNRNPKGNNIYSTQQHNINIANSFNIPSIPHQNHSIFDFLDFSDNYPYNYIYNNKLKSHHNYNNVINSQVAITNTFHKITNQNNSTIFNVLENNLNIHQSYNKHRNHILSDYIGRGKVVHNNKQFNELLKILNIPSYMLQTEE